MASDTPAAAIHAGIAAEAKFYDDDEDIKVPLSQVGEQLVRRILAAAEPHIRAEEREACAELAEQHQVTYAHKCPPGDCDDDCGAVLLFADLIRARTTP